MEVYLIGLAVIVGLMTLLWLLSLALKNSSIVDPFWGAGFVIANWVYFALTPDGFEGRKWLISILVTIWGLRLSLYLLWRNRGKGEDFRYQKFRQDAGKKWWWYSYFQTFLLQGVLLWIISAPLLAANYAATPARLTVLDYLAVPVWALVTTQALPPDGTSGGLMNKARTVSVASGLDLQSRPSRAG